MHKYIKKFLLDYSEISEYYNYLVDKTKSLEYVGITNEWLIDNYYLIIEHKNIIIDQKKELSKNLKKSTRIFPIIKKIVEDNEYNIDNKKIIKELNKYQKNKNMFFLYDEIYLIPALLLFMYVSKLNILCRECYLELQAKDKIKKVISEISDQVNVDIDFFKKNGIEFNENSNYIFEINNQLKELGTKSNKFFKELNLLLEDKGISLKEVLNDEYQRRADTNLLISNIFNNLKYFLDLNIEDLYEGISKCEKYLMEDSLYNKMTKETKMLYRAQIKKLSKKAKLNEIKYLERLMDNAYHENYHIGFQLFKPSSNKLRFNLYLLSIIFCSILVCFLLSQYFIKYKIIGFIILLIPVFQLSMQIISQVFSIFCRPKPLFKMDYTKKIPEESATMVVIPTIIKDIDKIKEVFNKLETFYIFNKSNNLYFTLLGDVTSSDKQVCSFDKELAKFGEEYAATLNKKYKKDLFYFIYRKRIWNEKENSYLGYERKRGALLQFNRILLGKMSKTDEKKYFNVNTLSQFNQKIKYVITLDTDSNLVLNSILNLVGCMAHPLNKPILNKEKTKVVNGYAIMQPRISIDIESTNKSIYSQIFAGIGGFDTYSSIIPNVNQDCFGEGNFIGKGIYDLEIFDQILYSAFPDNLILSHDLLEGNYLRCGYVSDIELYENFPANFLTDITRHHRWARGDVQIIGMLLPKFRNKEGNLVKNPMNLLERFKILDNIIRLFLYPMLLLIIILSLTISKYKYWFLGFVVLIISMPVINFIRNKLYTKKKKLMTIYYKNLLSGGKSLLLRTIIVFATIPYYTYLYMDAFFRTLYRLFISHKNLLNWITAEEVEKTVKKTLSNYLRNFKVNLIIGLLLLLVGIFINNTAMIVIALLFLFVPFLVYYVSKDLSDNSETLSEPKNEELKHLAKNTWHYFEENLTEENNFLIPDNYQENREEKIDNRTSPTDIAFSLISVVSAYELKFINYEKAKMYLQNILNAISSLEKWNGHLFNWYDIKTKKVMNPRFISTIDSGNLVAALILVSGFLKQFNEKKLIALCDKLIDNTNFQKLYTKRDVLSIGYDETEGKLSIYNYNKFASESRLTSYVAICKGDIPSKHWFCLDKSLTTHNHQKGLISWSGTAFEYYMPLLFMKNYKNTLLDESYNFAYVCQKDYMESINKKLPWGVSESAYDELDNALNYKYKSFSVPYLKAREEKDSRIVISPYSSLMAINLYPNDVYENILKFRKLNMIFKYGFYEAYDYSSKGVVKACFSHHQGMILMGLTNYLENNIMQKYFHNNVKIKTFEILLKEKVQVKADIDIKMTRYKQYNYNKENIENDIRVFDYISDMPEVSVLSNKKYCVLMNDRGLSFSRYRTLQLNRYRKITEQDYGMFMYIKNVNTNKIWSNTYAPINIKPDQYQVVFASDKIKYLRKDGLITTKTEIIVTRDHHAEIRKVTFKNDSNDFQVLELTTYTEPILSENPDDISHRVFNNMFLESEYDSDNAALLMVRKSRTNSINNYMVNRLLIERPVDSYSYETDRYSFIGRNHTTEDPIALYQKLSNKTGCLLEPIMSLRNRVEIAPNDSVTVYFICGFGRSKEQIKDILNAYDSKEKIEKAFQLSNLMNIVNTKNLHLDGKDMRIYNIMLNYLYQTTRISVSKERQDILRQNALAQNGLWRFGISGDRPIILVNIKDISNLSFVFEILKAFEYFKYKSIFVDVIIINSENNQYAKIIKKEIEEELYRIYTLNSFYHTPGIVSIIHASDITEEEMSLLRVVPRLSFNVVNNMSLEDAIIELQKNNKISNYKKPILQLNIPSTDKEKLKFDNTYGGFKNNGYEYVITNKNTPTPWSNIISNGNMGTIITNNGCGFTYAYNSSEYKISSWTNEMVVNDKSEGIAVNGNRFDPEKVTHGFGYSILESETDTLKQTLTEFITKDDTVKIYLLKLSNKNDKPQKLDISFWMNPTLGNFEEKTSRHILSEFMGLDNYLKLRNVYSIDYSDVNVFISSSEKITKSTIDKILIKDIHIDVELDKQEEKEIVFLLGATKEEKEINNLITKYATITKSKTALTEIKKYWQERLTNIQVKTGDSSFDYMLNGWYLYQTLSSRIMAKSGFYQVSGAFGYRDQLQDAVNICMVMPQFTKEQILINAKHQFIEGDVLHWWHEKNHFGLRGRYKDDYLWLVYATIRYLEITKDISILKEEVEFVQGDTLTEHENERGMIFTYSSTKKTLLEHIFLSLSLAMNSLGEHHLPLMGGGDWNDGMNKVGIKGKGESVWLGFFLYDIINNFVRIMKENKQDLDYNYYEQFNEDLKNNLNKYAWDKDYYLRAYFDNGDKLGSYQNSECKIDLISQSFAILSEVIPNDKINTVLNSVENNLVDKDNHIIKLLDPPFDKSLNNPGYIMNYPKGIRENGGQYTHATAWYIMALLKTGNFDKAYEYFQMINPINRSLTKDDVMKYKVEPYVIAADIYSAEGYEGCGGWTWYTGSAGWFYRVGIEEILGLKRNGQKLMINPKLPKHLRNVKIIYKYQESIYNIEIIVGDKNKLVVNDKPQKDNTVKLDGKANTYYVQVFIKESK